MLEPEEPRQPGLWRRVLTALAVFIVVVAAIFGMKSVHGQTSTPTRAPIVASSPKPVNTERCKHKTRRSVKREQQNRDVRFPFEFVKY
jgi:hypothetical protein